MKIPHRDVHEPDLRVGNAFAQAIAGAFFILVEFKFAGLDVDGGKLVFVRDRQLWAHLFLEEVVAPAREFFGRVATFRDGHLTTPR